jgi:hypothetical protein
VVTFGPTTQIGNVFTFTWSSDLESPTYYIYVNGEFDSETFETTFDLTVPPNGQFQFSVFDDPDERPPTYLPPYFTLRWDGDPDSVMYRVEQYIGSVWTAVDAVPADDTRVFHYDTGTLADSTVHQFRITGVDAQGRPGAPLELEGELCRYPDAPEVTLSVSGGEITVE